MFFFSVFFYSILGLSSFLDRPTALVEKKKFKERIKYAQVISTLSQNQPKAANLRQTKKESTNTKQPWGKKKHKAALKLFRFCLVVWKKKEQKRWCSTSKPDQRQEITLFLWVLTSTRTRSLSNMVSLKTSGTLSSSSIFIYSFLLFQFKFATFFHLGLWFIDSFDLFWSNVI